MKKTKGNNRQLQLLKAAAVILAIAAWAAVPLLTSTVKADGEIPLIVRTAVLSAPSGAINPHGEAEWQLYPSGNREIEVEIEDVSLAAGTSLNALVDGNTIGQIIIDSRQQGKLKLRTEDGQTVPVANNGSTVEVRNGSTVLVAGVFGGGGPSPTPTATPTGTPTGTPSPSPSPTGTPNAGELFAGLTGPTLNGVLPGGFAEFETESSHVELEVRVRQVNLPIGTSLSVVVNGTAAGNLVLTSGGEGRLKLRSDNGQTVPVIVVGSTISVKNGAATILSGTFASFTNPGPTPTPTGTPAPTMGRSFEAHLTGSQITPPVTTAARGEVKVKLNTAETQATISGEFDNLSSIQTGARIETTVGTTTTFFDLGVIGGIEGHFAPVTINVTAAQVQQLRAGVLSAVIMSTSNPAGEIRGLLMQHSSESDFDGDGSSDFAVFRPSSSTWYSQNTTGFSARIFGSAADIVVSGDYDGDGKTDAAVYKNINGQGVWEIMRSSDAGVTSTAFGLANDVPVRGDFDGDGRIDLAVFRPSTGVWYVQKSDNSGYTIVQFGLTEDKAIPADMDGDGKDDITVFRPSDGNWYWLRSSDGQFAAMHFGQNGDVPVRGDFDGDGRADATVFRPSTGVWYTLRSSDGGFKAVAFGLDGDIPVAGNYDADGTTDIAVFRPSDGNWYILRSSDGSFQAMHFGLNGDIPLIAR